jgi:hypothetical protein
MSEKVESFRRDLAEVHWRELKIHLQRDAIITVAQALDIIDVAVAVADDDKGAVEGWIAAEQLGKPTEEQLKSWEKTQEKLFRMLIVQPFILIQDVLDA